MATPLCTIASSTTVLSSATDRAFTIGISDSTSRPTSVTLYYVQDITNTDLTSPDQMLSASFSVPAANITVASGVYTTVSFDVLLTGLASMNYIVFGYVFAGPAKVRLVSVSSLFANQIDGAVTTTSVVVDTTLGASSAAWNTYLDYALIVNSTNVMYIITAITGGKAFTVDRAATISDNAPVSLYSLLINSAPPMTAPVISSVAVIDDTSAKLTLQADGFTSVPNFVEFTILSNLQTAPYTPSVIIVNQAYAGTPYEYTLTGLLPDVVYSICVCFIRGILYSPLSDVKYYATSTTLAAVTNMEFERNLTAGSLTASFTRPIDAEYNIYPVKKYVLELLSSTGDSLAPSQTFTILPNSSDTATTVYSQVLTSPTNVTLGTAYNFIVIAYDTTDAAGSIGTYSTATTAAKYLYPIVLTAVTATATSALTVLFTLTPPVAGQGPITTGDNARPEYWVQPVVNGVAGTPAKQEITAGSVGQTNQALVFTGLTVATSYTYNIWPSMSGDTDAAHSPSVQASGTAYNFTTPITPIDTFTVTVPEPTNGTTTVTNQWTLSTVTGSQGLSPSGYEITASYAFGPGSTSNPSANPSFINLTPYIASADATQYIFTIDTDESVFVKVTIIPFVNVNGITIRAAPTTNWANQSMWGNPAVYVTTATGTPDGIQAAWPQANLAGFGTFTEYTLQLQEFTAPSTWTAVGADYDTAAGNIAITNYKFVDGSYTLTADAIYRVKATYTITTPSTTNPTTGATVAGSPITTLPHYSANVTYAAGLPSILSVTFSSDNKTVSFQVAREGQPLAFVAMVANCNTGTSVEPFLQQTNLAETAPISEDVYTSTYTFVYPIVDCILIVVNAAGGVSGAFAP